MKINRILLFIILLQITCWMGWAQSRSVVILHTNDTHSQMEPFIFGSNKNTGGMMRLAAAIEDIRAKNKNVLLFDAGDFWQSTSYFNLFEGKVEVELLNTMKYDAVTLGNHQFDLGVDTLAARLKNADFQIILSNYDLSETPLNDMVKPYTIFEKGGIKIGIIGVCVELKGLVTKGIDDHIHYQDPIPIVNELSQMLKKQKKCDVVVVLSHLGYQTHSSVDDIRLAEQSENVDIIIGGHTHTPPEKVFDVKNKNGENVIIRQMQRSGIYLGRIDIKK